MLSNIFNCFSSSSYDVHAAQAANAAISKKIEISVIDIRSVEVAPPCLLAQASLDQREEETFQRVSRQVSHTSFATLWPSQYAGGNLESIPPHMTGDTTPEIDHGAAQHAPGALCRAAYRGRLDVVLPLSITPGIDINEVNKKGMTPLGMASYANQLDVVMALL